MCIRDSKKYNVDIFMGVGGGPEGVISAAALENREGQFVYPTAESGAIAVNGIKLDANLAGRDPNPNLRMYS